MVWTEPAPRLDAADSVLMSCHFHCLLSFLVKNGTVFCQREWGIHLWTWSISGESQPRCHPQNWCCFHFLNTCCILDLHQLLTCLGSSWREKLVPTANVVKFWASTRLIDSFRGKMNLIWALASALYSLKNNLRNDQNKEWLVVAVFSWIIVTI